MREIKFRKAHISIFETVYLRILMR